MLHPLKKKIKAAESAFKETGQRKYLQSYMKHFPALENSHSQSGFYETFKKIKQLERSWA